MKYRFYPVLTFIFIFVLLFNLKTRAEDAESSVFSTSEANGGCSMPTFEAGKAIPVNGFVGATTSADFNNDGKKDVVVATGSNPATLGIYLGDANGNFTQASNVSVPRFINWISAADFNADGKLDVLISHRSGSTTNGVTLLSGDGSGQLTLVRTILTGGEPGGNVTGDFNQDDKMDFAVPVADTNRVLIYHGDNGGNFSAPVEYLVGTTPNSIKAADFNADGRVDLVVANSGAGYVSVLLGKSSGGFEQSYGVPSEPTLTAASVATGDVNNDGKADVIVNARGSSFTGGPFPTGASILLGNGAGGFTRLPFIGFDWGANTLWTADVSGDGKLDLVGFSTSGVATVKLGGGDGTFGPDILHGTAGGTVSWLVVDDFNYDDKPDLLESSSGFSELHLFNGTGDGKFGAPTVEIGGRPNSVTTADFNGDGKPDVAASNYDLSNISVMLNNSAGGLSPTYTISIPQQPISVFSGDFNRDGKLDVGTINFAPSNGSGGVSIAINNGNGFNPSFTYYNGGPGAFDGLRFMRSAVVADVTGDGILDIVTSVSDGRGYVSIQRGNNDGSFGWIGGIPIGTSSNSYPPYGIGVGDLNLDGNVDIVGSAIASAAVFLGTGNSSGNSFTGPTFFPITNNAPEAELVIADFNHDNIPDIAMTSNTPNFQSGFVPKLHVALGNGSGGFHPSTTYTTGSGTASIATGDFNNDSHLDLAVAHSYRASGSHNRVGVMFGDGTGAFSAVTRYVADINAFDVGLADFDGDGRLDIVTPNYNIGNVSILRNVCPPEPPGPLPALSLSADSSVDEGDKASTSANFTVTLSAPSQRVVRTDYRTSPGTAGTRDYQPASGTLVFQPGDTSKTITVPIKGDLVDETNEQLSIFLNNPHNASIANGVAVLTINEDTDPQPTVSIADVSVTEGNSGSTVAAFPVTLSAVSGKPVTVSFAVSPGTATPKVDYDTFFGSVTIPPGTLSRIVAVTVSGDSFVEPNETFSVTLSDPVNATINRAQAVGSIVNDDVGGTIQFATSNMNVPEPIGSVQVMVTRTGGNASDVVVGYTVGGGTAIAGVDFHATPGTLVFAANETTKTITIEIVNDALSEADENFFVSFTGVSGGGTISGSGVSINLADDDPLPNLTVSDQQIPEGSNGVATISLIATLNVPSGRAVSVSFTPVPGTATAPSDYIQQSGSFSIPAGQTQGTLQLSVVGDLAFEPNETFSINLTNPTGAVLTRNSATITLINDDNTNRLFDFDGDDKADLSFVRSGRFWHIRRTQDTSSFYQLGETGDRLAPADYDGDSKTDIAVFRPSEGKWYVLNTSNLVVTSISWGADGDLPVPTDRDGDGRADFVVYRESNNTWYTRFANDTFATTVFGEAGDRPMLGDFDADGLGDIALFRPSNNNWYIIKSSLGYFIQTWGEAGDVPVTADFDGDGATDQAVFRPSTGQWFLSQTTGGFSSQNWGQAGDIPVAADYDGDGRADVAVFRPSNSTWYVVQSAAGIVVQQYGDAGDVPTPSAFNY